MHHLFLINNKKYLALYTHFYESKGTCILSSVSIFKQPRKMGKVVISWMLHSLLALHQNFHLDYILCIDHSLSSESLCKLLQKMLLLERFGDSISWKMLKTLENEFWGMTMQNFSATSIKLTTLVIVALCTVQLFFQSGNYYSLAFFSYSTLASFFTSTLWLTTRIKPLYGNRRSLYILTF